MPTRLLVSRLHVSARVVPVAAYGSDIDVPDDPAVIGWWVGGAAPGSSVGPTVLVGHVDSARTGPGALFHLDSLRRFDVITVEVTGGQRATYRVDSLTEVRKTAGLAHNLLSAAGSGRLVLITCGGAFDAHTHSYLDNIVVTAHPG